MSNAAITADSGVVQLHTDGPVPVIVLPDDVSVSEARTILASWLPSVLDDLSERSVRLDLRGRRIDMLALRRLATWTREEFEVHLTGIVADDEDVRAFAGEQLRIRVLTPEQAAADGDALPVEGELECVPTAEEDGEDTEPPSDSVRTDDRGRRTLTLSRTLRSGAVIRFDGDIVLMGDVNPGAHIVATGNVFVLGTAKGLVHAGATGDESAFIFGFDLRPTQLRIARKIAIPPERASDANSLVPQVARIADSVITIAPYRGRAALK